jgi:hypothetical protein
MQENQSLVSALAREPNQIWKMLRVAMAGAIAIVLWDWLGGLFLPNVVVLGVLLVAVLAYAAGLTYLIARLVRDMDRWQIETARQASRLASTIRGDVSLASPHPQASFYQAYFLARLDHEVREARRHGQSLSIIAIEITLPDRTPTPEVVERMNFEMAHLAASQRETIGIPLSANETEFVFYLPSIDNKGAKAFLSNLLQGLGGYWCHFGIASYPADGTNAETLFARARESCQLSKRGAAPRREVSDLAA